MTRTRTGDYKGLAAAQHDRHHSRNGADPRAIPKKAGAGHGNWGVPGCELDQQEQASALSSMAASPPENKITVIDAETFSRLQNSSEAAGSVQSMADDEQHANENASSSTTASS